MVGPGRLELPTSRLSGVRSNHLSYGPVRAGQAPSHDNAPPIGYPIDEDTIMTAHGPADNRPGSNSSAEERETKTAEPRQRPDLAIGPIVLRDPIEPREKS